MVETRSAAALAAFENHLAKLERCKLVDAEKVAENAGSKRSFDERLERATCFFADPWKLWASERLEDKGMALKLVFGGSFEYHRKDSIRTVKIP